MFALANQSISAPLQESASHMTYQYRQLAATHDMVRYITKTSTLAPQTLQLESTISVSEAHGYVRLRGGITVRRDGITESLSPADKGLLPKLPKIDLPVRSSTTLFLSSIMLGHKLLVNRSACAIKDIHATTITIPKRTMLRKSLGRTYEDGARISARNEYLSDRVGHATSDSG
jgi:hypothetical protein